MLSRNCGICRLFEDSTPKVSPGQDSDLEEQKLSEVQSHQGVKWLVTYSGFQKDWQRPDNAVLGKQKWEWRLCCIEQREKNRFNGGIHPTEFFFHQVYPVACLQGHTVSG